jgi:SAM-dependent methyltransferase
MDETLYREFFELEEHYWWSVGTRRLFARLIAPFAAAGAGRVVDVGCGTGITLLSFPYPAALLCGCDFSPLALDFSRRRGLRSLLRSDATRLPFRSDSVDLVLALDVIEHLDDDAAAVAEIARVTRRGGHVLVHVPAFSILWSDKDDLNHHRRRYRRAELQRLIERAGLRVRTLAYVNAWVFPIALARALLQRRSRTASAPAPSAQALDSIFRIPPALNRLLLGVMGLEARLLRVLPFGMSLVCLAEKPADSAGPISRTHRGGRSGRRETQ